MRVLIYNQRPHHWLPAFRGLFSRMFRNFQGVSVLFGNNHIRNNDSYGRVRCCGKTDKKSITQVLSIAAPPWHLAALLVSDQISRLPEGC